MKELWVLSVRTSLPKKCYRFEDMPVQMQCFDSFEKARDAFRQQIKNLAFSKNAMFDGKGRIIYLDQYSDTIGDEDDASSELYMDLKKVILSSTTP